MLGHPSCGCPQFFIVFLLLYALQGGIPVQGGHQGGCYYRKDVARRYCAAAARGETTTRPAPAASNAVSSSDSAGGSSQAGAAAPDSEAEAAKQAAEEARQYIQSLLRAPPNMHAIVADPAGRLLFTSSLGSSDCAVRVWRLHWGGDSKDGSSTSCPGRSWRTPLWATPSRCCPWR